jgi:hypothetical protein
MLADACDYSKTRCRAKTKAKKDGRCLFDLYHGRLEDIVVKRRKEEK